MKIHKQHIFSMGVAIITAVGLSATAEAVTFTTSPDPTAFSAFDDSHGREHGDDQNRGHGHDRHGDDATAAFVLAEIAPQGDSICLSDSACFDANADILIFRVAVDEGIFDSLFVELPGLEPLGVGLFSGDGVQAVGARVHGSVALFDFGAGLAPVGPSATLFMTFAAGSLTGDETIRLLLTNYELDEHGDHDRHGSSDDDDSDSDSDGRSSRHEDWFDVFTGHHGHQGHGDHNDFDDALIAQVGVQSVPEPGSLMLMVVGLVAAVGNRRR